MSTSNFVTYNDKNFSHAKSTKSLNLPVYITAPGSSSQGQIIYNTSLALPQFYDGTNWQNIEAGSQNATFASNISALSLTVTNNATIGGNINTKSLQVTNNGTFGGNINGLSLNTTNSVTFGGNTNTNSLQVTNASTFGNDIFVGGHIISTTTHPSLVTADGVKVTSALVTGTSTDIAGVLQLATGNFAGEGTATVTYNTTYTTAPIVIVTPASLTAQYNASNIAGYYVTSNATNFVLNINNGGTGVTNVFFNYIVIH